MTSLFEKFLSFVDATCAELLTETIELAASVITILKTTLASTRSSVSSQTAMHQNLLFAQQIFCALPQRSTRLYAETDTQYCKCHIYTKRPYTCIS